MILLMVVFSVPSALAHSPHDVIFSVAVSPTFHRDKVIFLIVSNTLMISTDKGYSWKKLINGLDYTNQMKSLSISPNYDQDETVFVSSDGDGIYRSQNGGRSWEKVNAGLENLGIDVVQVSRQYSSNNKKVFAIDNKGRLWSSGDGGDNWHPISETGIESTCLTFLPFEDGERVLLGTNDGRLLLSEDAAGLWKQIWKHADIGAITSLAVSPFFRKEKTVWAGTERMGVFEINLKDGTSHQVSSGLTDKQVTSLYAGFSSNGIFLYASTWDEGFFSLNKRENKWEKRSKGLTTDIQARDPAFWLPNFKGIAVSEDIILLGGFDGLFESKNYGEDWTQLDTISPRGITGLDVSLKNEKGHYEIALATYGGGAYILDNSYQNWSVLNKGLQWTRLNDIFFSPTYSEDGLIFSGSENNFLFFSKKYAAWQRIPVKFSLKRRIIRKIERILAKVGMDAATRHKLFTSVGTDTRFPTSIAVSPAFDKDRTLYFGTRSSGIYVSFDVGKNNSILWDANEKLVTALCVSPNYQTDGTLFAGIYGVGVFKTKNKGHSWRKIGEIISAQKEVHLAISPSYGIDKTIVAGSGSGLFISADEGLSWHRFGPNGDITCLAISPDYDKTGMIVAGIKGKGLWVSRDKGASFLPFATELIENNFQAKYIKFSKDFSEDSTIYCATSFALFRSVDAGQTWEMIYRPLRYEDMREEIKYEGNWVKETDEEYSALTETFSNVEGSRARLIFVGGGIRWIGSKSNLHGSADVFIDGELISRVSQSLDGPSQKKGVTVFETTGLERKSHEIVIKVTCFHGKNPCGRISIDALESEP
jgi:photosystem II stability/assembly factor-like uncharacterized protein